MKQPEGPLFDTALLIPQKREDETHADYIMHKLYRFFTHTMMWFPEADDGVPPFCRFKSCPMDHRNSTFNGGQSWLKNLGEVGFPYFDQERKLFLGIASFVTFMTMGATIFGCSALSTNASVVQQTYWAAGEIQNTTSGEKYSIYIGLQSLLYVNCPYTSGVEHYSHHCYHETIPWASEGCGIRSKFNPSGWLPKNAIFASNDPILNGACATCANEAISMWTTAVMNCVMLILAFLGAQTRMRVVADVPLQKLLGMAADSWGAITLAYPLYVFDRNCLHGITIASSGLNDIKTKYWLGPGYICYIICCIVAIIRASIHWLTPLPGKGSGLLCCCFDKRLHKKLPIGKGAIELIENNELE